MYRLVLSRLQPMKVNIVPVRVHSLWRQRHSEKHKIQKIGGQCASWVQSHLPVPDSAAGDQRRFSGRYPSGSSTCRMGSRSTQKRAAKGTSFASVAPTPLQSDLRALKGPPCHSHKPYSNSRFCQQFHRPPLYQTCMPWLASMVNSCSCSGKQILRQVCYSLR